MNHFDSSILLWLNQLAGRFPNLEALVQFLSNSEILKGQIFIVALWWFWFAPEGEQRKNYRDIIIATLFAGMAAILLGRVLALFLPFRVRPAYNPDLGLIYHTGTHVSLRAWSAFPSDHAMLFAALATGLFFISPRIGAVAFVYALVVIDLPRVYLGLHHPTDILAGALLGTLVTCGLNTPRARNYFAGRAMEVLRTRERLFYVAFLTISIEILTMFNEPRELMTAFAGFIKSSRHHDQTVLASSDHEAVGIEQPMPNLERLSAGIALTGQQHRP